MQGDGASACRKVNLRKGDNEGQRVDSDPVVDALGLGEGVYRQGLVGSAGNLLKCVRMGKRDKGGAFKESPVRAAVQMMLRLQKARAANQPSW